MTIVAWHMLLTHLVGGSGNPVSCISATVPKDVLERLVSWGHVLEGSLLVQLKSGRSACSMVRRDCSSGGRVEIFDDNFIDVTGGHTETVNFGGNVTCVTRHVLFVKVHLAVAWAE